MKEKAGRVSVESIYGYGEEEYREFLAGLDKAMRSLSRILKSGVKMLGRLSPAIYSLVKE